MWGLTRYGPQRSNRTKQSFDSAKVRFEGGAAAIAVAIADHVREKGVNVLLDCTVNRISTEHGGGVVVEGVLVSGKLVGRYFLLYLYYY